MVTYEYYGKDYTSCPGSEVFAEYDYGDDWDDDYDGDGGVDDYAGSNSDSVGKD